MSDERRQYSMANRAPSIASQYRDEIIHGIASGKRLSDLGLPVSPQAISKVLHSDPEYRSAVEAGFNLRLDEAEKAIESAADSVDVARAKARFQSVAWRAEREFPERWGAKTETKLDAKFTIELVQFAKPLDVVDGELIECQPSAERA